MVTCCTPWIPGKFIELFDVLHSSINLPGIQGVQQVTMVDHYQFYTTIYCLVVVTSLLRWMLPHLVYLLQLFYPSVVIIKRKEKEYYVNMPLKIISSKINHRRMHGSRGTAKLSEEFRVILLIPYLAKHAFFHITVLLGPRTPKMHRSRGTEKTTKGV